MNHLVLLLEEPSAKDLLESILPQLVPPSVQVHYLTFEGKSDLEKHITRRMRGWRRPNTAFLILRDQDAADCKAIKARLSNMAAQSMQPRYMIRIACRELESWILGDWQAVSLAFKNEGLAVQAKKSIYRNPDQLSSPVEELRKHLPEYQKRDGARRVGRHLDLNRNCSPSFKAFCQGVQKLISQQALR